jgi:mannose/cellobiose epimerase-like protein (N-acyl-D-glucosamine 2-epimerase family)
MEYALENLLFGEVSYGANTGPGVGYVTELIRQKAYEFFEARGCEPGHDLEDWLRAELEIKRRLGL